MLNGDALPQFDSHVHSEFSWDAPRGDMSATCERAVALGLRVVAFTEHADFTPWASRPGDATVGGIVEGVRVVSTADGGLDRTAYLAELERCRVRWPQLRVRSGVELGEPHRFAAESAALLAEGGFDVILGSVHCLPDGAKLVDMSSRGLLTATNIDDVYRTYLAETLALVETGAGFSVLAHLGYPRRYAPEPIDDSRFEAETRAILEAAAHRGLVLELNSTRGAPALRGLCPQPRVVVWWRQSGGERVCFGSDAHDPQRVGSGLAECAAVAGAAGFRADRDPAAPWRL